MRTKLTPGDRAPDFTAIHASGEATTLATFDGQSLVLVFTRYVGCPVCQMETIQLAKDYPLLAKREVQLAVLFQSEPERLANYAAASQLPYHALSDVSRQAYRDYGVDAGISGFLSPNNFGPIFKSLRAGHRHGKFEGNELQYPAVFVLDANHRVCFAHYGRTTSDSLAIPELIARVPEW